VMTTYDEAQAIRMELCTYMQIALSLLLSLSQPLPISSICHLGCTSANLGHIVLVHSTPKRVFQFEFEF
jgi:hypothetical protein